MLIEKLNLGDHAIDFALNVGTFDVAMLTAEKLSDARIPEIHLRQAMHLEDQGDFLKAEEHFINASTSDFKPFPILDESLSNHRPFLLLGKPLEAIEMFVHVHEWEKAIRLAETFMPTHLPTIFIKRGEVCAKAEDFETAEIFFLKAHRPELAIDMYKVTKRYKIQLAKLFVSACLNV